MAKACSPFLVTVATLDKTAYKYIADKHGACISISQPLWCRITRPCSPGPAVITIHTKGERAKVQSGAAGQLMWNFKCGYWLIWICALMQMAASVSACLRRSQFFICEIICAHLDERSHLTRNSFNIVHLFRSFPVFLISPLPTENVTEIKTNIFVTSFGPVSDTEMVSWTPANSIDTSPKPFQTAVGYF